MRTKLLLICVLIGMMMPQFLKAESGKCGENLTWTLDNGTLTISGIGEMADYYGCETPWYSHSSAISRVVINDGVTSIGVRGVEPDWEKIEKWKAKNKNHPACIYLKEHFIEPRP